MNPVAVTVHRRVESGDLDRYGNPIFVDRDFEVAGGLFAPGGTSEPVEVGRAPVVTAPTLYFRDSWPDIRDTDQVTVRGVRYRVDGAPADWRPLVPGGPGGLVVSLRTVVEQGVV